MDRTNNVRTPNYDSQVTQRGSEKCWHNLTEDRHKQWTWIEREFKQGRQVIGLKQRGAGEIDTDNEQGRVRTENGGKLNKGRKWHATEAGPEAHGRLYTKYPARRPKVTIQSGVPTTRHCFFPVFFSHNLCVYFKSSSGHQGDCKKKNIIWRDHIKRYSTWHWKVHGYACWKRCYA